MVSVLWIDASKWTTQDCKSRKSSSSEGTNFNSNHTCAEKEITFQ